MLAEPAPGSEGRYLLEQTFRYTYEAPVRRLHHRLMVVPRVNHGGQRRLGYRLTATGDPVLVSERSDGYGNHVAELRAAVVSEQVEFTSWALISRTGLPGTTAVPGRALCDPRLRTPTRLTEADGDLADAASDVAAAGPGGLALAERACTWARRCIDYEYGVTGVRTTAAEALAGGRGVGQDYAHIMLALCRAGGLACRYVSGHLVGEGGSHAWTEVVVPDPSSRSTRRAVAVAFDPTHDRRAGAGYLTVAVGATTRTWPTCGTFEGDGPGTLSADKRLRLLGTEMSAMASGPT